MGSCNEERTDTNSSTATTAGGSRTTIISCLPQGKILSKDEPVSSDSHNKVFVVKNTSVFIQIKVDLIQPHSKTHLCIAYYDSSIDNNSA